MSTSKPGRNTDKNSLQNTNNPASATPDEGRSAFSVSTSQGNESGAQKSSQLGGDAYKQDNQSDKASSKENEATRKNTYQPPGGTKQGSGATGYDTEREQEQANQEREDMNNERDQNQIDIERTPTDPDEQQESGKPDNH